MPACQHSAGAVYVLVLQLAEPVVSVADVLQSTEELKSVLLSGTSLHRVCGCVLCMIKARSAQ